MALKRINKVSSFFFLLSLWVSIISPPLFYRTPYRRLCNSEYVTESGSWQEGDATASHTQQGGSFDRGRMRSQSSDRFRGDGMYWDVLWLLERYNARMKDRLAWEDGQVVCFLWDSRYRLLAGKRRPSPYPTTFDPNTTERHHPLTTHPCFRFILLSLGTDRPRPRPTVFLQRRPGR
jgi:hypothetical protein